MRPGHRHRAHGTARPVRLLDVINHRWLAVGAISSLAVLSACGGGGSAKPSASKASTTTAAASPSQTSAGSTDGAKASRAGSIDVCGLLSEADAADVAAKAGLGGAGSSYKLTATKVDQSSSAQPMSSCKFKIEAVGGGGGGGTVQIDVVDGDNFAIYKGNGKAVSGLGDEAVSSEGTTVVRVGDLMLQTSEDSFTQSFVVALYQKMIPKMR